MKGIFGTIDLKDKQISVKGRKISDKEVSIVYDGGLLNEDVVELYRKYGQDFWFQEE